MMGAVIAPLPDGFIQTREAARALACYVLGPARKAFDGHIGLQPSGGGFGTPPLDGGRRVLVLGDRLVLEGERDEPITTLRAAARLAGVALSVDPGVGRDLPPLEPDVNLAVNEDASFGLGAWFSFAETLLEQTRQDLTAGHGGTASERTLWPEHFDLAFHWGPDDHRRLNIGASPGDAFHADPYLYIGPWNTQLISDERIWNTPFGAVLPYGDLLRSRDPSSAFDQMLAAVFDHLSKLGEI